tara:strand:+ start:411 stop:650 length:240 start_codon:yes stop_codon:yes gene_type:complete
MYSCGKQAQVGDMIQVAIQSWSFEAQRNLCKGTFAIVLDVQLMTAIPDKWFNQNTDLIVKFDGVVLTIPDYTCVLCQRK